MTRTYHQQHSFLRHFLLFVLLMAPVVLVRGGVQRGSGERPAYVLPPMPPRSEMALASLNNMTFRQNVCDKNFAVQSGNQSLPDALRGMEIRVAMQVNDYFRLNSKTGGIDDQGYAGIMTRLMDELAQRGGFTWRNSYGVTRNNPVNRTSTETLLWSTEQMDLAANWWDNTQERLESGINFLDAWFDGSMIMVGQQVVSEEGTVSLWNWLLPFTNEVWYLVFFTLVASAIIHQFLEYICQERDGRSWRQWTMDNFYISILMFTQNYEFHPIHLAGRIFGISMAIWALIMSATYTANLASLLVTKASPTFNVEDIHDAISQQVPLCTYQGRASDIYIQTNFPRAIRIPKPSEAETLEGVRNGDCRLAVIAADTWRVFQKSREHNPDCDLKWIGRTIHNVPSGFATKVDSGHYCSSLIRTVTSLHMRDIIQEGLVDQFWDEHMSFYGDANWCAEAESDAGRRQLSSWAAQTPTTTAPHTYHRDLKAAASGRASSGAAVDTRTGAGSNDGDDRLTVKQLAGTFILHGALSVVSIIVALAAAFVKKREKRNRIHQEEEDDDEEDSSLKVCPLPECAPVKKETKCVTDMHDLVMEIRQLRQEMSLMADTVDDVKRNQELMA